MKRFIKNLVAFTLLLPVFFGAIVAFDVFIVGNQYSQGYQAAMLDKIDRLKTLESPKIILVGNSSLAFGVDSSLLERELEMPVVNLGLNGALGNSFSIEAAKLNIQEGDLVVFCPSEFSKDNNVDYSLAWITLEKNFDLYSVPREEDWPHLLRTYPKYAVDSFVMWVSHQGNKDSNVPYSRNAFNVYGDVIFRPEESRPSTEAIFRNAPPVAPVIDIEFIEIVNKFHEYVENCGASLVIGGYPIGEGEYTASAEEFNHFGEELGKRLKCPIISDYSDYFIPYNLFYDTRLHLTEEGAQIYTKQLALDLKDWIREKDN